MCLLLGHVHTVCARDDIIDSMVRFSEWDVALSSRKRMVILGKAHKYLGVSAPQNDYVCVSWGGVVNESRALTNEFR